jgi:hypothetical protein
MHINWLAGGTMKHEASWRLCIILTTLCACTTPQPEVPPLASILLRPAGPSAQDTLTAAYERSIRAAAVRDPDFQVTLRTISPKQL